MGSKIWCYYDCKVWCTIQSVNNLSISFTKDKERYRYWDSDKHRRFGVEEEILSAAFKSEASRNRVKHFQKFISSIRQGRNLLCDLDLVVSDTDVEDAYTSVTVQNGKMSAEFRLIYKDNTYDSDLKSFLGVAVNDSDVNKVSSSVMPTTYSVNVRITGYNSHQQQDQTNDIPKALLRCILSNCHHITNIRITDDSNTYWEGYIFRSTVFIALNKKSYIITPARFESFLENSTPTVDCLTHSTCKALIFNHSHFLT